MLADLFPRTHAAHPQLLVWNQAFSWATPLNMAAMNTLLARVVDAAEAGLAPLLDLAIPLHNDVAACSAATEDLGELANLDIFRFLFTRPVATAAIMDGDFGLAFDWVLSGITRGFILGQNINHGDRSLPPFVGGDPDGNALATANLVPYFLSFYTVAVKLGGLDELGAHYGRAATALAMGQLTTSRSAAVKLLAIMGQWMAERRQPQAPWIAGQLAAMFDAAMFSSREKIIVGTALAGGLAPYTDQTAGEWARRLLGQHRNSLVEHEVLQFTILATDSIEQWQATRDAILGEARALAAFYRARIREGGDAGVVLEAHVKILHPLFHLLASTGTTDDVMDLLSAWYCRDGIPRGDADVLFVCSAYGDGTAYLWPTGRSIPEGDDPANLDRFLATLSLAHSQVFRGPAGDLPFEGEERRWGRLNHDHAEALRRDMAALYDFDRLRAALPEDFRPRSLVIVPSHRDPVQAELANALGWLTPVEASVAQALQDRPRRLLSIWRDDAVQLVDSEIELLQQLGPRAGWEVRVTDGPKNAATFRDFYEDPSPDLIWVIGHGEMDAHDIGQSGIHLHGEVLPLRQIGAMATPDEGRRLLVLNICSGGAAQNRGGMGHLGLAQSLAGPKQQVIAHQWPIDSYPALAFAAGLMVGLLDQDPPEALRHAGMLMRDLNRLRALLGELTPGIEAIDRLDTDMARAGEASVLNWGNAALYC